MKLNVTKRLQERKSDTKKVRRSGDIPAILYTDSKASTLVVVAGIEFETALRQIKTGRLPTTIFTLVHDGKEIPAIVKDIQYHPTTYKVLHVDFQKLDKKIPVTVKVPIECIGIADCPGIKLGGFLRQVIRYLPVECLPDDIPAYFEVSVAQLAICGAKRLGDLAIPKGVKPLAKLKEVAVVIAKR
jgi:large subunit ribosomal protein L25